MTKRIAITIGDPTGIGAEVVFKAFSDPAISGLASWMAVGDEASFRAARDLIGANLSTLSCQYIDAGKLDLKQPIAFGQLRAEFGLAPVEYVRRATLLCRNGEATAMVTAPLSKEAISLSRQPFTGHTEYIAEFCEAAESRMLLASE
jgi:4-phospho-D-threonate 3-dehydrogenase / 4-phospho-D-erythronate 3-dehydrogenase